jgi:MFS family permease
MTDNEKKNLQKHSKWLLLTLISFFDFGSSFIFDIPQSLSEGFCKDPNLKICDGRAGLFYSAYSLPNLVVILIGGYILHKKGHRFCLWLYCIFVFLGMAIFFYGALYAHSFTVMYIGRVVEGIGAENLMITQYYATYLWFNGKGLSLAIGLNQSLSFFGSILGFFLFPYLYLKNGSLRLPLSFAVCGPALSLISILIYVVITKEEEQHLRKVTALSSNELITVEDNEKEEDMALSKKDQENVLLMKNEDHSNNLMQKTIADLTWQDLKSYSSVFWTICIFMLTISPAYFLFINQLDDMIQKNFDVDYKVASTLSITIPLALMILVPLLSLISDRKGNKSIYFVISAFWGIFCFLLMKNVSGKKWLAVPCLANIGLFYSIFSSVVWSGGAQSCPPQLVDFGLAIMNTVQSIATFFFPILFVKLGLTTPAKLLPFLIGMIIVGLVFSLLLMANEKKKVLKPDLKQQEERVQNDTH